MATTKQFNRTVEVINDLLDKLDGLPTFPLVYQGEVLEYTDLPEEPAKGDCYLVSFETGTDHVSNKLYYYSGAIWKEIAVDGYTKHEIDTLLSAKQDALTTEQLAAINSGITSEDVEQIETNKNNISSLWDSTSKNHYKITATQSTTGITYTKISESELAISGTYTGRTYVYFNLTGNNFKLPAGTWKFRFTTTGTVPNRSITFGIQGQGSTTASKDTDYEFTTTGEEYLTAYVQFLTNDTVNGSIRIMVRPASISDPTYQPYALSNVELTAKEQANENNISYNTDMGVKNLINIRTGTEIVNGVTFTFNADKTVTVSGTATGGAANLNICSFTADEAYALNGKILSGCPANGSDNTYKMQLQRNSSPWNIYAKDTGNETTISGVAQASCILLISIAEGQTVNLTFKPMIRQFGDNTYQPYAMSNAELTAAIQALQAQLANQ